MNLLRRLTAAASRTRPTRLTAALVVLSVLSGMSLAQAAYSQSASLPAMSISTGQLEAPSGLSVSQTCTPPPPVVFRGAMSNSGEDAIGLLVPSGVQAGDVLIAQVSNRNGAYGGVSAPSGWTLLGRTTSGGAVTEAIYWKIAGSTEPLYYAFYLIGASKVQMVGGIAAYGGVDQAAPVHAFGTTTGAGPTASTPSVTTTVANVVLLHTMTKRQDDPPAPAGTLRWRLMSGTGTATAGATAADEPFAGPGATPVRTSPTGFATDWVAHTIAVRPAPGTPSVSASWTATPSTWATGHRLERTAGGVVTASQTLTPRTTTSTTDGPLSNGVAYTYRLSAYRQLWTSPAVTASLTTNC